MIVDITTLILVMTIYKICPLGKLLYFYHFLLQLSTYTN